MFSKKNSFVFTENVPKYLNRVGGLTDCEEIVENLTNYIASYIERTIKRIKLGNTR